MVSRAKRHLVIVPLNDIDFDLAKAKDHDFLLNRGLPSDGEWQGVPTYPSVIWLKLSNPLTQQDDGGEELIPKSGLMLWKICYPS